MDDVRLILSALWVAVTFCYVIAAVLGNFKPGALEGMMAGEIDGIQITQNVLVGNAVMMVLPGVMVFLSLALPYPVVRWANIALSMFFTGVILITLVYYNVYKVQVWAYYYVIAVVEVVLYALIVWYAWNWI